MKNNLYDLVFEADDSNIRSAYFTTLENINEFARINSVERTLLWVRIQLEETMQKMCNFVDLPEVYSQESSQKEIGFSLFKFDQ